jgi:hypothetical protein
MLSMRFGRISQVYLLRDSPQRPSTFRIGAKTTIISMQRIVRCPMRFTLRPHVRMPRLRGHFSRTMFPRRRRLRTPSDDRVARVVSGIDVNPNGRHLSRFSFRRPQCVSLRDELNVRSTFRFNARKTPMRACINEDALFASEAISLGQTNAG